LIFLYYFLINLSVANNDSCVKVDDMQSQLLAMQAQIDELREAASNNITAVNTKIDALVVDN